MDIITELSSIDSKHRISSKYAAQEILHEGQVLFDIVFDKTLNQSLRSGSGRAPGKKDYLIAIRCAEACGRAAREKPEFAQKRAKEIVSAILKAPKGDLRYFLCELLINIRVPKGKSKKCADIIKKWLSVEKTKGPKACYLEAIASLAARDKAVVPVANGLISEALKSPVPSYSARARQIVMRLRRKPSFFTKAPAGNKKIRAHGVTLKGV